MLYTSYMVKTNLGPGRWLSGKSVCLLSKTTRVRDPEPTSNMPGMVLHTCHPGSGEAETGASLGLAEFDSLDYLMSHVNKRHCF